LGVRGDSIVPLQRTETALLKSTYLIMRVAINDRA
jgi:hypothetical protein